MNAATFDKAKKIFEGMVKNASPEDIKKIGKNLSSMNKGKIAEIWDQVMGLWKFAKDPQAPWAGKAVAIAALIYLISPVDAIPDIIPILGLTDDAGIITLAISMLSSDLKKYQKNKV